MNKKNIIIVSILIFIIVIGVIFFIINYKKYDTNKEIIQQEEGISALTSIYNSLIDSNTYKFKLILNDDNNITVFKKQDKACVELFNDGEKEKYIVKDGNTYLLIEDTKEYYEYKNNTTYLTQITDNMETLLNEEFTTGTEKIDNKDYKYEEFSKKYPFILNYKTNIDVNNTKTRIYFEGKDLKYIKTYIGDIEQLLKVEKSFDNINDEKFEIPEEYKEG